LAFSRHRGHDATNGLDETHVQHAITLVEHQGLNAIQPHMSLLHEIKQATGRGHQDLGPAPDAIHLRLLTDAAEHHHVAQGKVAAIGGKAFADCEASSRVGASTRARGPAQTLAPGAAGQAGQDGDGKGSGFAGAGLRAAEQIAAGQEKRNGLRLDSVGTL